MVLSEIREDSELSVKTIQPLIEEQRPSFLRYLGYWFLFPFVIGLSAGTGHFIAFWISK